MRSFQGAALDDRSEQHLHTFSTVTTSTPESTPSSWPLRRGGHARGFTLFELLTVVTIIGVIAALATVSMTRQARSDRLRSASQVMSELYQTARARSLGRGAAVLVQWDADGGTGGKGRFIVSEAIQPGTLLPRASCTQTDWADPAAFRALSSWDLGSAAVDAQGDLAVSALDANNAVVANFEMCFTPTGRSFVRTAAPAFAPATSLHRFVISKADVGPTGVSDANTVLIRTVFVPPTGIARLAL